MVLSPKLSRTPPSVRDACPLVLLRPTSPVCGLTLPFLSLTGRAGLEPEIAGPLIYLSSAAGGYVSGDLLVVDGGRLLVRIFPLQIVR
jgi:NAD(P)-dependent dehydrogenase (short-subunit alcohol dehydrogenase family)